MHVVEQQYTASNIGSYDFSRFKDVTANLVFVFGSVNHIAGTGLVAALKKAFPGARLIGCSTSGEITRRGVAEDSCVVTAVGFASTDIRLAEAPVADSAASLEAGHSLGKELAAPDLRGVCIISKGLAVNGSALIDGVVAVIGAGIPIVGGLAGDAEAFSRTLILTDSGVFDDRVAAIGFYGDSIRIGYGAAGGWQPFGTSRKVTAAEGNVLLGLDGEPALNIYKRYLGDYAAGLPASGLLFPLEIQPESDGSGGLTRTILSIDETKGSITLAGNIEEAGYLRLMHGSTESLVEGARAAATTARATLDAAGARDIQPTLALLVSCVGRKLVMGSQTDEEIETVLEYLDPATVVTGFYSYGEICPMPGTLDTKLHNQTMTAAFFAEL